MFDAALYYKGFCEKGTCKIIIFLYNRRDAMGRGMRQPLFLSLHKISIVIKAAVYERKQI